MIIQVSTMIQWPDLKSTTQTLPTAFDPLALYNNPRAYAKNQSFPTSPKEDRSIAVILYNVERRHF